MFENITIFSSIAGVLIGFVYGIAFVVERRHAVHRYVQDGGSLGPIRLFSWLSLVRYGVLLGILALLIHVARVDTIILGISFLVAFWGCMLVFRLRR